ncbi:MAG: CAP domain-containing protein [Alkalispirochaeta sp.]
MDSSSVTAQTYTLFQRVTVAELNFLRTSPRKYAEMRLRSDYRAGTDNGAYSDLMTHVPVAALKLHRTLCRAAQAYATHLATHDRWGHCADRTPRERARAVGYHAYGGENVAAGRSVNLEAVVDPARAARLFVLRLVVNEGVPGVGHRRNMLSPVYRVVGIGYAADPRSTYLNYTVQDFGLS